MQIQVVQDLTCPWCRIGKHNLDAAIAKRPDNGDAAIAVEWVPFLLDPVEPGSEENYRERLSERKNMTPEQIDEMVAGVKEAGEKVGLTFNYDKIKAAVDTVPGHQMVTLAPPEYQSPLLDAIHQAYFEEGKNIGDTTVLTELGRSVGIPQDALDRIQQAWSSPELRTEMIQVVQQVQSAGITGVPFFIIDSKLGVSGAQPADVMVDAMQQAEETPAAD